MLLLALTLMRKPCEYNVVRPSVLSTLDGPSKCNVIYQTCVNYFGNVSAFNRNISEYVGHTVFY